MATTWRKFMLWPTYLQTL